MAEEKVKVEEAVAEEATPVVAEEKAVKAAPAAKEEAAPVAKEEATPVVAEEKAVKAAPAAKEEAAPVAKEAPADNKRKLATAEELLADAKIEPIKRRKGSKNVPFGIAFVKTTFNNTIVSITDMRGAVISWSSAGRCNFKGSRKSTAFAATTVAQEAARGAIGHGMTEVEVRVQGPGAGRESAVRAIQSAGLTINCIKDTTAIPHNGCRPPKRRRV
jgi:small subunit ribosomal protein S11